MRQTNVTYAAHVIQPYLILASKVKEVHKVAIKDLNFVEQGLGELKAIKGRMYSISKLYHRVLLVHYEAREAK